MEVALAIEDGGEAEGDHAADVGGAETGDEEPDEALLQVIQSLLASASVA